MPKLLLVDYTRKRHNVRSKLKGKLSPLLTHSYTWCTVLQKNKSFDGLGKENLAKSWLSWVGDLTDSRPSLQPCYRAVCCCHHQMETKLSWRRWNVSLLLLEKLCLLSELLDSHQIRKQKKIELQVILFTGFPGWLFSLQCHPTCLALGAVRQDAEPVFFKLYFLAALHAVSCVCLNCCICLY